MKQLFELDLKDYIDDGITVSRPSVRAIIYRDQKYAMVYSRKFNYYKFPGGGIEAGESMTDALIREVLEETGLEVIPSSIEEFGMVHRVQKGDYEDKFIQDNYYYTCRTTDRIFAQSLDDYENNEGFCLRYMTAAEAMNVNKSMDHQGYDPVMLEREIRILRIHSLNTAL